jgi:CxxC motif-containing protein (DUF1111 family)
MTAWGAALAVGLTGALVVGCAADHAPQTASGIFAELGEPLPSATVEQLTAFERGRAVALRRFTPEAGLGPEFNLTFCTGCHEKPVFGGSASHYRDFLLVGDELVPDTIVPRGKNGVQRQFSLDSGRAPSDELTNVSATRNPMPFFGVGLLAEIPEGEIVRNADPDDEDGDGISGRVNYDGMLVGRFGRKAQTARIEIFVRGPLFNHLGITSDPLSIEQRASLPGPPDAQPPSMLAVTTGVRGLVAAQSVIPDESTVDLDDVPDPELSSDDLFDLVAFSMLLAAPEPDPPTPETRRGQETFRAIGCEGCHLSSLQGPRGAIPAYTDLLLHDMGEALGDRFPMGEATGREFRTQPLWGVVVVGPYLHDGRAATLDEAIRWHGGEAEASRDAYEALSMTAREGLLAFLESLGGRTQRTEGLLPPDAPIPEVGQYGGPVSELSASERESFALGQALFDRDFSFSQGVGPFFNGDACRSCHFDPVIGGAGPSGVDAIRQGRVVDSSFVMPSTGTALPRLATTATRPEPDEEANFFEPRQTPTTLGLGLLERIPRDAIETRADPDDLNRDGISGRAHVLQDGRLGRFGWKANVPSVREFVRDALSGELGMTVPNEPQSLFGVEEDGDDAIDPEIDGPSIDAIATFIELLGPPPRTRVDPPLEDAGEAVFVRVGCAGCHVPTLETADGVAFAAFTDLLLHDVVAPGAPGIEEGEASMHEFRTPPLWGLGRTEPYFHDGRASTIEAAIAAHAGEASGAQSEAANLSASDREALLAFLRSL